MVSSYLWILSVFFFSEKFLLYSFTYAIWCEAEFHRLKLERSKYFSACSEAMELLRQPCLYLYPKSRLVQSIKRKMGQQDTNIAAVNCCPCRAKLWKPFSFPCVHSWPGWHYFFYLDFTDGTKSRFFCEISKCQKSMLCSCLFCFFISFASCYYPKKPAGLVYDPVFFTVINLIFLPSSLFKVNFPIRFQSRWWTTIFAAGPFTGTIGLSQPRIA